jgi:hypothetical protein
VCAHRVSLPKGSQTPKGPFGCSGCGWGTQCPPCNEIVCCLRPRDERARERDRGEEEKEWERGEDRVVRVPGGTCARVRAVRRHHPPLPWTGKPPSNQPTNAMTLQRSRHIASTRVICAYAIHPSTARTYMPRRALTVGDITGRDACPCCDNLGPELGGICAHAPKKPPSVTRPPLCMPVRPPHSENCPGRGDLADPVGVGAGSGDPSL